MISERIGLVAGEMMDYKEMTEMEDISQNILKTQISPQGTTQNTSVEMVEQSSF